MRGISVYLSVIDIVSNSVGQDSVPPGPPIPVDNESDTESVLGETESGSSNNGTESADSPGMIAIAKLLGLMLGPQDSE
jgi:hypothetical protein